MMGVGSILRTERERWKDTARERWQDERWTGVWAELVELFLFFFQPLVRSLRLVVINRIKYWRVSKKPSWLRHS